MQTVKFKQNPSLPDSFLCTSESPVGQTPALRTPLTTARTPWASCVTACACSKTQPLRCRRAGPLEINTTLEMCMQEETTHCREGDSLTWQKLWGFSSSALSSSKIVSKIDEKDLSPVFSWWHACFYYACAKGEGWCVCMCVHDNAQIVIHI